MTFKIQIPSCFAADSSSLSLPLPRNYFYDYITPRKTEEKISSPLVDSFFFAFGAESTNHGHIEKKNFHPSPETCL
jgi:hypothetical protein